MAFERARAHLASVGLAARIQQFEASSATVELAAQAVRCEPARIAKTLSFLVNDRPLLVVAAGDARVSNQAFKQTFGVKASMIPADRVEALIGHAVGGVCPFGIEPGVEVHLDVSLLRFDSVFPACGSANSAVELTPAELVRAAGTESWVSVTTVPADAVLTDDVLTADAAA